MLPPERKSGIDVIFKSKLFKYSAARGTLQRLATTASQFGADLTRNSANPIADLKSNTTDSYYSLFISAK